MPTRSVTNQSALLNFIRTTQGKTYTVTGATVLLLVLMLLVGVFPAISTVGLQTSENQKREKFLSDLSTNVSTVSSLITEKDTKTQAINSLNYYLPEFNPQATLLTELEALNKELNVQFKTYSFTNAANQKEISRKLKADSRLTAVGIRISVTGSRESLLQYLQRLESSVRVTDVINVSLFNSSSKQSTYTLDLQANYYYWKINE